jgi:hypothetical protein
VGNDTEADVSAQFQLLIQQGSGLQTAFDSEKAIEPKHIAMIRAWINQALDLIEPAVPPGDIEFNALTQIRQAYSNTTSILPGNTSEHIRRVHAALVRAHEYFRAWCTRDFSQIEPAVRARASHAALDETWRFSRNELLGELKGKQDGRTKRTALLHSYGRMFCWAHSMVKLGNDNDGETLIAEHSLGLAACLRAIFEIFLDVNLLRGDRIKEGPEKFFCFEKVARHKIAQSSLELDKEYKHLNAEQRSQMTAYAGTAPGVEGGIDDLITRLWGLTRKGKPDRPEHWTGMTVIDRVKDIGGDCIRYYQHSYHYCNWSLHSGYIEFLMATEERASLFCALLYLFANEMFRRATEIMIEEFAEFLRVEALKAQLRKVQLRGAHVLWDAAVKAERTPVDKTALG